MRIDRGFGRIIAGKTSFSLHILLITAVMVVLFGGAEGFSAVTNGPVLLRSYQDRVALMWESDSAGAGTVYYGIGENAWKNVTTSPQTVEYKAEKKKGEPREKKTVFIHKTWLRGLEAGKTYNYRIGESGQGSGTYHFRTVPADSDEVTFVVYGDSRTNPEIHRKIVEQIIEKDVDFVVHTGDLVTNGEKYRQWGPQFFEPLRGLAESVPIYIAKGNHEGNNGDFEKLFIPEGEGNNFGFGYGPLYYSCSDNASKGVEAEKVLEFIVADLAESGAKWKFVSYHIPSLNFGGHWSSWESPQVFGKLAEAKADIVVAGHSHQYERFRPLLPPFGSKGNILTFITAGGGGAPLYNVERTEYNASVENKHHFCLFQIKGDKLTMQTFDIDGEVIDRLEIIKKADLPNSEYMRTGIAAEAVTLHQRLHSALSGALGANPQKGVAFTVEFELAVPVLGNPTELTFKLRGEGSDYLPGEPESFLVKPEDGSIKVSLSVTPLTEVEAGDGKGRAKPIKPELWIDCDYKIGWISASISQRVLAR